MAGGGAMSATTPHEPQHSVLVVWTRGRRHYVGVVQIPDDGPARVVSGEVDIFHKVDIADVITRACERARACGLPLYQRVGHAAYPVVIEQ